MIEYSKGIFKENIYLLPLPPPKKMNKTWAAKLLVNYILQKFRTKILATKF